jgi:hexosaminidase
MVRAAYREIALLVTALLPLCIAAQDPVPTALTLMPVPATVSVSGQASFTLDSSFQGSAAGVESPLLDAALERTLVQLSEQTGLQMSRTISQRDSGPLVVTVKKKDQPVQSIDEDESYSLHVTSEGVRIEAANSLGAMHGLQTLLQLVQANEGRFFFPAVTIHDDPRFRWRGLMIDCSRHFEPLDVLKRNLDAMAAVKLNVFHWHLMDDQGVRVESKRFPRMTERGSDGLYYTQDQVRELVEYARARGIRVVPEFEMPGHSTAWLVAYPELNSGSTPSGIRREFGISAYALDPTREATYTFITSFLEEMTTLFPDQYVHIGGDETPAPDWKTNPRILAFMQAHQLKDNEALQAYFNQRVVKILSQLGRRMVGWDEILSPTLPKNIVIQSWRGDASLGEAARQGYQGILSAPYYLDGMKPASTPYLADPVPMNTTLTPAQQQFILGGEICMWAEHLNGRTIDSRLWPRSATIAERFWSPQNVTDVNDMYRRLQPLSVHLESLGLTHLSSEDAGLRSLAGSEDIAALRTFASAFEPVSFGERSRTQHTMQFTPLTGFVDAVVPDPPVRYAVQHAAEVVTDSPQSPALERTQARALLENFFATTAASVPSVEATMDRSPRLAIMRARAAQLSQLDAIGSKALEYLQSGTAPAGWKAASLATIAGAKKPDALVRFHFLDALTMLVEANR